MIEKSFTTRIWERNGELPIDVGIRDSGDNARCWKMLGGVFWEEIGDSSLTEENEVCLDFEIDNHEADFAGAKCIGWEAA